MYRIRATSASDTNCPVSVSTKALPNSPSMAEVKAHIWGPYRLAAGAGSGDERPDSTGRAITYDTLPLGETHLFLLEPSRPARWMEGTTQGQWLRERGTVIRFELLAVYAEYGQWRIPGELDSAPINDDGGVATVQLPVKA